MRILCISNDEKLLSLIKDEIVSGRNEYAKYDAQPDPLEVMSTVCSMSPSIIVIDDDLLKPNSAKILTSIKKVSPNIKIVFFTSDSSLELGREISPLGVLYYGLKPASDMEIKSLFESINKMQNVT
jgi:DNA-binding NarL/FixJ family response regulator